MANILIVDDEPSILKVLSTVLSRSGYSTACVENAEGALKKLAEAGEIHLKSTFFCNGGMINIPWEEWSLDRLIAWLESYFQEGIQGLPDWCSK